MFKRENRFFLVTLALFLSSFVMILLDWSVDGFDLFKAQDYQFYFQSWVSLAGLAFALSMALTMLFIYKKTKVLAMRFLALSFLLTAIAYLIIGYHASYCQVCSDLSMCSGSHNYSNFFTIIALTIFALTLLLSCRKNSVILLKLFSYGLITATLLSILVLFISIQFMEIPGFTFYAFTTINLQGFVFLFPMILLIMTWVYFRNISKVTTLLITIFSLLFISLIPQAYHIFACSECHTMECSEFYLFAGLLMFMTMALLIYAVSLHLEKK